MFMPIVEIPQRLFGEPPTVAAVGPALALIFRDVTDRPPSREMRELLRRIRDPDEPEPYWRRFYSANDNEARWI
jgi:hypothetical protein